MFRLDMLMGALILAGLVQVVQDVQDVLGRLWPPAFRSWELEVRGLFGRGMGASIIIRLGA